MLTNDHARAFVAGRLLFVALAALSIRLDGSQLWGQAASEVDLLEVARSLHEKAVQIRASEYGDVHLIGSHRSTGSDGYLTLYKFEFWALENKYFRIDRELVESSDADRVGQASRMIVRPEGMVQLAKTENGWAVVQSGDGSEGRDRIEMEEFLAASTRCFSIIDSTVVFGRSDEFAYFNGLSESLADKYSVLTATRQGNQLNLTTELHFELEGEPRKVEYRVGFDLDHGVLLDYTMIKSDQPVTYKSFDVTKQYNFPEFKHIPVSVVNNITRHDGTVGTEEYRIESVDWEPVPIGIFSLGAQGVASPRVWMLRVIVLVTGLTLFAIYLVYRRQGVPESDRP